MAPLKVGIIGAGIGGLSAAIALRRAGADVEIFEKSTFKNEVGAAIAITPNGARILESWGLDAEPPASPPSSRPSSPSICPSKSPALYASAKARAVEAARLAIMPAQTLLPSIEHDMSTLRSEFGAPMRLYHRVDLHTALWIMAMAPASWFAQAGRIPVADDAVLRLGARVANIDCEKGTVKLEDGKTIQKDLLVVANGIQSSFIHEITESRAWLKYTGWTAYHFMIPMESVLDDPSVSIVYGAEQTIVYQKQSHIPKATYRVASDVPKAFYMVAYPCRDNEVLSVVVRHSYRAADGSKNKNIILHRKRKGQSSSGSDEDDEDEWEEFEDEDNDDDKDKHMWNARHTPKRDLLKLVAPYHPALCKLVLMADDIRTFRMRRREPLERYHRGRAVLLGDAAGAIWPTHAQGSVLAIEEAAALELLFSQMTDASLVPQRLELYTSVLKRHIHLNQHLGEAIPGAANPPRKKAEALWNLIGGAFDTASGDTDTDGDEPDDDDDDHHHLACEHERKLFSSRALDFSPEVRRFFYGYDVRDEVRRALEGMPTSVAVDNSGGEEESDGLLSAEGGASGSAATGERAGGKGKGKGKEAECSALRRVWLEMCGKKGQAHAA